MNSETKKKEFENMDGFRNKVVELFVNTFGKESPNFVQVKLLKSILPNGADVEKNPDHQAFFKSLIALCQPLFTCHYSHLEAGAKAVHEQSGLKGLSLKRKTKHDAEHSKEAMTKINKARYHFQKSKSDPSKLKSWHKIFFGGAAKQKSPKKRKIESVPEEAETHRADARLFKKTRVRDQPPQIPEGYQAADDEKVMIYYHSEDFSKTRTLRCKPAKDPMRAVVAAAQASDIVFELCDTFVEAATGKTVTSPKEFKYGDSYKFIHKEST